MGARGAAPARGLRGHVTERPDRRCHENLGDAPDAARDAAPACAWMRPPPAPLRRRASGDVVPILQRRCLSCHDGAGEQWPLTTYGHVSDWRNEIRSELIGCTMPPPDAGAPLPEAESLALLTWIRCGLPP